MNEFPHRMGCTLKIVRVDRLVMGSRSGFVFGIARAKPGSVEHVQMHIADPASTAITSFDADGAFGSYREFGENTVVGACFANRDNIPGFLSADHKTGTFYALLEFFGLYADPKAAARVMGLADRVFLQPAIVEFARRGHDTRDVPFYLARRMVLGDIGMDDACAIANAAGAEKWLEYLDKDQTWMWAYGIRTIYGEVLQIVRTSPACNLNAYNMYRIGATLSLFDLEHTEEARAVIAAFGPGRMDVRIDITAGIARFVRPNTFPVIRAPSNVQAVRALVKAGYSMAHLISTTQKAGGAEGTMVWEEATI